jgi:hypothetical protein
MSRSAEPRSLARGAEHGSGSASLRSSRASTPPWRPSARSRGSSTRWRRSASTPSTASTSSAPRTPASRRPSSRCAPATPTSPSTTSSAPVILRGNGVEVTAIYPFAKAIGGLVVPIDSTPRASPTCEGATIAAGSLRDKSLLILRALTISQYGFDPQEDGEVVAAAPPLMQQLIASGEVDAGLPLWHFVARIEGAGQGRELMPVTDMLEELGLPSDLPNLVILARDDFDADALKTRLHHRLRRDGRTMKTLPSDDRSGSRSSTSSSTPARPEPLPGRRRALEVRHARRLDRRVDRRPARDGRAPARDRWSGRRGCRVRAARRLHHRVQPALTARGGP